MPSFTPELILPTWKKDKWQKGLRMPELTLPVLAALTPPDIEVIVTEEEIEDVTYKSQVERVGISYMTPLAEKAGWVAREFYSRSSIISRFPYNWRHPLLSLVLNASFRAKHRKKFGAPRGKTGPPFGPEDEPGTRPG